LCSVDQEGRKRKKIAGRGGGERRGGSLSTQKEGSGNYQKSIFRMGRGLEKVKKTIPNVCAVALGVFSFRRRRSEEGKGGKECSAIFRKGGGTQMGTAEMFRIRKDHDPGEN